MYSNNIPSIKRPTTFEEQVEILKSRGLVISDVDSAIRTLQRINYYRLSAYTLSLKKNDQFLPDITFEHVVALYEFDRRFRYLIMEMVEQVEIAFRTHISYHIAHTYGPLGHLNPQHFDNHDAFLAELEKELKRSQELFIKHHYEKYEGKIPVWVAIEVLSFGALSKLFSNMKNDDKNQIAKRNYRAPAIYLESWLKCMSYIRNICAHYGRLYNRPLTSKPRLDRKSKQLGIDQGKIFAHLYVLKDLIPDRDKWLNFIIRLEALLSEYSEVVELDRIGFPEDWEAVLMMGR
ncbi:Abi family protein [Paenibacillus sp. 32O-W]|jgi:abortive infection bacteriophage resistance protein|uniref:Abi family protein n=1 Tax=Paenibacillus sp. 32O-W TaxID=1695218 RepID=UPI0011A49FE2|nr:Abi family protein [Paenibacillus sp. 32O-W]